MNIVNSQYSMVGSYLEIFVSGCNHNHKCKGTCFNPELWDFTKGDEWKTWKTKLYEKINDFRDIIDYIVITGGEPGDQDNEEMFALLVYLARFGIPLVYFTSYTFKKVSVDVKETVSYIKCEPYIEKKKCEKDVGLFKLTSSNQILYRKEPDSIWSCI